MCLHRSKPLCRLHLRGLARIIHDLGNRALVTQPVRTSVWPRSVLFIVDKLNFNSDRF